MQKSSRDEIGTYYRWSSELGAKNGIQYYSIEVLPARYFDPETNQYELRRRNLGGYTFVIEMSEMLVPELGKIRELIAQGALKGKEVPFLSG
jgi:hypothetical protein